jgi:hypothetical protein
MKSWTKPTPELVARAIAGMLHLEQQRYFFDRLENPEWIEPLRKAKFFEVPPTPEQDDKWVRYRLWPASRYLSRMAALRPELVADIMASFPASDSPYVIQDILNAAAGMPAASAAKLADAVAAAARSGGFVGIERAGEIALSLAQAGLAKASLKILDSVFEVVPDRRPATIAPSGREYRHEARTRIRPFDFGNILRIYGPGLTTSLGTRFLDLLSTKLTFALQQEYPYDQAAHSPVMDYSYIWRPHLDFADMREEARQLLITGVLQVAELMASDGLWKQVSATLQRQHYDVFERIQLFLLAKYPELDLELASQKLADRDLFHDYGLRQEFNELARTSFPRITSEQQQALLALIDKGLDTKNLVERGLSGEQIEQLIRQWRFARYEPIHGFLSLDHLRQFEELKKEFGDTTKFENPVVRGFAVARDGKSPATEDELQSMAVPEVVAYLKAWSPDSRTPFGPSHQGLATELTKAIATAPERYIGELDELKTLQPIYVRATLQGLRQAAMGQFPLAWRPLLSLAEWICTQTLEWIPDANENHWDAPDMGWQPSRFAVVDLLEDALQKHLLPISEQKTAWKLLVILSNNKTEELDYRDPNSLEKDVWSYSLNTLRPRAMRAVLNYIEWLQKRSEADGRSVESDSEIALLLDHHLDIDTERSLPVRLIYGEKLPFLCSVLPVWAGGAIDRIFPEDDDKKPLRDVAWGAYLAANQAYIDVFRLTEPHYRTAIRIPDDDRKMGKSHLLEQPSAMLSYHLVQLYWWGKLDLSKGSVFTDFLATASESALRSMLIYVGRSLSEAQEEVADETIVRLRQLWDYVMSSDNAKGFPKVFANFGWWFSTKYFEDAWALDRLQKSLVLADGAYEPVLEALSRLSGLARTYPKVVLDCTKRIVLAQNEYVELFSADLSNILTTVLASGDTNVAAEAAELVNELGRRGHLTYRTLLKSTGTK